MVQKHIPNPELAADILWIKGALDHVKDPFLIDVFKSLLRYQEHQDRDVHVAMVLEAEEAFRNGQVTSHEELKEEMKSWRK